MQGIECYALKITMIGKTPTPHHRKNAVLPAGYPWDVPGGDKLITIVQFKGMLVIKTH